MSRLLDWLDHRTGCRRLVHEALYEAVPGGARWRYVWGSTLVFTFFVQMVTGIFLWMFYSPSSQSAWESVYFLQEHVYGGAVLRGVHHYTAGAMVVLLAIHLAQVVIDGAYKAPREFNFWIGLVLMLIVLGLALTGYLLPWDQKGYWATKVATRIAGLTPGVGPQMEKLVVGGDDYGHYTLTRFFALHAGVLPGLLIFLLVIHVALFRRHGLTARISARRPRPDAHFWPDQVLRDAVACLAVLAVVLLLAVYFRPELGAPADGADDYAAARPEWYFLFLFQFLKLFHGETGEVIGAIVIPTAVLAFMFLMPFIGRSRFGHRVCVTVMGGLLAGATVLTIAALYEDRQAEWFPRTSHQAEVENALMRQEVRKDLDQYGEKSKYHGKSPAEQLVLYFDGDEAKIAAYNKRQASQGAYQKSLDHLAAVAEAEEAGQRAAELAGQGVPPQGALWLVRNDPKTQGPKLFRRHCAACHDYADQDGHGIVTPRLLKISTDGKGWPIDPADPKGRKAVPNAAPNLYGFASRPWLAGFLDPKLIAHAKADLVTGRVVDAPYFGNTSHFDGDMVGAVKERFAELDDEGRENLERLISALSAEAGLRSQRDLDAALDAEPIGKLPASATADERSKALIAQRTAALEVFTCMDCHQFHGQGEQEGPDLTGYGSRQWLLDFISNPAHERFYGEDNDRMPAFAADEKDPAANLLSRRELELLVDWLRGEWYEPPAPLSQHAR